MAKTFEVSRELGTIAIAGRLNADCHHFMMEAIRATQDQGFQELSFDLRRCDSAYPDGLVPLAATADWLRQIGVGVSAVLPDLEIVRRLLLKTNVAYFLDPAQFASQAIQPDRHVQLRRFETLGEQVAIVRDLVDVALRMTQWSRDVLQGFEWSINEVMDNVLNHANSPSGGFIQATTFSDRVAFTVADCGQGILASLREGYPGLRNDTDAIGEAVKAGVTRNPDKGQGNGLAGTLRIATQSGGSFTVSSGRGILNVFHKPEDRTVNSKRLVLIPQQSIRGTIVSAQILRNAEFRMDEALGFTKAIGGQFDVIEAQYETEDGTGFMIKLAQETTGFGSRMAGEQFRNKCLNLLNADPSKPLVIDWQGIPVISSSFADESFGKLFVNLGPIGFAARVRNLNMEPLVRKLVDKAVVQRMAQASELLKPDDESPLPPPTNAEE